MSLAEFFSFLGFSAESSAAAAAISKENDIISVDHLLSCSEDDLAQMGLSVGVKRKILSYKQSGVSLDTFLEPNKAIFDKPKIIGIQKELQSNLLPIDSEITKLNQTLHKLEQYRQYLSNGIQSITEFLTLIETMKTNPFQAPLISHTPDNRTSLTSQEESNVRIIMRFYSTISSHSTNRELVLQCGNSLLTNIIKPSKLASEIFLEECSRKVIERSLLQCCDREMRICFRDVLWGALKNVIPDSYSFREETTETPTGVDSDEEETVIKEFEWIRVMNDLFELMPLLPFHWKNFSEFFQLFRLFANETNHQDFLYRKNFLGQISNLILRGTVDTSIIAPEMRDKTKDLPDFSAAVDVICTIIRLSDGHEGNPYALEGKKIAINEQSIAFVFSKNFLRKITFDPKEKLDNLGQLFCFLSYENRAHSQSLESFMREMTNDCEHYQIPDCFALIDPIIGMADSLQAARVEYFLYHLIRILNKFRKYPKFTCGMITHANRLYNKYDICKVWLDSHPEDWSWTFEWMQKRGFLLETR